VTQAQVIDPRLRGGDEAGKGKAIAPWRAALTHLGLATAAILAIFHRDVVDIVTIWWTSSTFNHCLLIVPILGWLVMQRKDELAKLTPQPWWPPLLYAGAGAFGWLLGDAAGVALARHLGVLMMLQGAVSALLGWNITKGLLFPFFYAFFLVPFGEELVPLLQTVTAKMCMWLLGLSGIPAHLEGIFISTPNALFRVAEACSGVKFLIAMVALGALVSNLCFKSWPRRAAFMAVCVVVPIIANGLRAFSTIYVGHHGNLQFAASMDHVIYGWVFFAVVIALVLAIGWRFFDRRADEQPIDAGHLQTRLHWGVAGKVAVAGLLTMAMVPAAWSAYVASRSSPLPKSFALPKVPGWTVSSYDTAYYWKPFFGGESHNLLARYRNASGQHVDFYAAIYDRQEEGRELVGFGQGVVGNDERWAWIENCNAPENARCERIAAQGKYLREILSFYRVNGVTTGSATQVKLETLKNRLFGGDQQAVAILIASERIGTVQPRAAIDAFTKDLGNIDKVADQLAGLR
jgi:exosortase A